MSLVVADPSRPSTQSNGTSRVSIFLVVEDSNGYRIEEVVNGRRIRVRCGINLRDAANCLNEVVALRWGELFAVKPRTIHAFCFTTGANLRSVLPPSGQYFEGITSFEGELFVWTDRIEVFRLEPHAHVGQQLKRVGQGNNGHGPVTVVVRILRLDPENDLMEFAYGDPSLIHVHRVRCRESDGAFISQEILFDGSRTDWVYPVGRYNDFDLVAHWDRTCNNLWIVKLQSGVEVRRLRIALYCHRYDSSFISHPHIYVNYMSSARLFALSIVNLTNDWVTTVPFGPEEDLLNLVPFTAII